MARAKISERNIILYTAALVLLSGLVRLFAYSIGSVFFYIAFAPFLIYRVISSIKNRGKAEGNLNFYRGIVLVLMIITIVLNVANWQEADFFLVFLLMVDFLLVINRKP